MKKPLLPRNFSWKKKMLGPVVETVTSSSANPSGGSVSHRIANDDNNIAPVSAVLMVA